MEHFVRGIKQENRLAGIVPDKTNIEDYNADLFNELQTRNNTVSIWAIEGQNEIDSVALALSSANKSLDKMQLLILDKAALESCCPGIRNTPENAETPYREFCERHHDVECLSYFYLGKLAYCLIQHYASNKLLTLYRDQIAIILSSALKDNKVKFDDLDKNLKFELASWILKHQDKSNYESLDEGVKQKLTDCLEREKMKPCTLSKSCDRYRNK